MYQISFRCMYPLGCGMSTQIIRIGLNWNSSTQMSRRKAMSLAQSNFGSMANNSTTSCRLTVSSSFRIGSIEMHHSRGKLPVGRLASAASQPAASGRPASAWGGRGSLRRRRFRPWEPPRPDHTRANKPGPTSRPPATSPPASSDSSEGSLCFGIRRIAKISSSRKPCRLLHLV